MEEKKNFVIKEKKIDKLFRVSVTAKKYDGWEYSPLFPIMGGLYGLMVGARRKREITVRIKVKRELPWGVWDYLKRELSKDYEAISRCKFDQYHSTEFRSSWIMSFNGNTKEEIEKEIKEYCKEIKEDVKWELRERFKEIIRDIDFRFYREDYEELKELGVIKEC